MFRFVLISKICLNTFNALSFLPCDIKNFGLSGINDTVIPAIKLGKQQTAKNICHEFIAAHKKMYKKILSS